MKSFYFLLLWFCTIISAAAQQVADHTIYLRSGSVIPTENISTKGLKSMRKAVEADPGAGRMVLIQFDELPDSDTRAELARVGVVLLDYVPNRAFTALLKDGVPLQALKNGKARALVDLLPEQKIDPDLFKKYSANLASSGRVSVWVNYVASLSKEEFSAQMAQMGFAAVRTPFEEASVMELDIPYSDLLKLADMPVVKYVQGVPSADKPINDKSVVNSRANVLQSKVGLRRDLQGKGVVVGVGDNADPFQHVDLTGRIINHAGISGGIHGVHVMGTLAGAGIMNERYKGYAPKATVVAQYFSKILAYASTYVADYGMVITNNSYGSDVSDCTTFGKYDLYSSILDQQAFDIPTLQHVFASGNSGYVTCSPYPAGFGNVLGGYQASKNVLTVGNSTAQGVVNSGSSRGPVSDGRLKPEIMAQGTSVMSTVPVNNYQNSTGTSMATPGVSGGLALLYERYRQLYAGQNPKNGLMKALLCNGATDMGNAGPDFKYGFGWMNLLASLRMLEGTRFYNDSLAQGNTRQITVQVPAGSAHLKVMLYWNDPAASVLSAQALVNDLDLTVTTPSGQVRRPLILSTSPAEVNNLAVEGVDHLNNVEQVVIDAPEAGSYTLTIAGTNIAQNPRQPFFVVYDMVPTATTLTYPIGGERLVGGETIKISWDSFGNPTSTYQVQYSTDNGASWLPIGDANLAPATRQLDWAIPVLSSDIVKVRVIQNLTGAVSASEAFTVLGVPVVSLSAAQTEGYFGIEWTPVAGATDYEVMILKGDEMVSKATVATNSYIIAGLSKDTTYYATVRARLNGHAGKRALAVSRLPDDGTSVGSASDHDLMVEDIVLPTGSGRAFTSSALGASQQLTVRIKNLDDDASVNPFFLNYSVNDNIIYSESVNYSIPAGGNYDHTFPVNFNYSATGNYVVKIILTHTGDPVTSNNILTKTFRQLSNDPLTLPFLDNFESLSTFTYLKEQVGLGAGSRYDFQSDLGVGRVRSYVGEGYAASGTKALTLDASQYTASGVTNYLIGTYNLANYSISNTDLRLNFKYKNHGQESNSANKVWIRGNDQAEWIEVFDLFANQNKAEEGYQLAAGIEVSRLLIENSQALTSSFQVRWGQWGQNIAADWNSADGYTFDDVNLYTVTDDIQLANILTPAVNSCSYSANESIKIQVRNSDSNEALLVPVTLWVDGGPGVTEYISSIPPRSNMEYTFAATANLSAPGAHTLRVRVDYATDSYADNNEKTETFYHAPLVTAFPYLQDFEAGNGHFFTDGRNSSWAYGTPTSGKIVGAASGQKAWKTNLNGNHNDDELSYLYSPCFSIGGLSVPMLSFSLALDLEECDPDPCDIAYVEYSGDGGAWTRLGEQGQGTNWYNNAYGGNPAWSAADYTRWHVASIPLPTGYSTLRIRFVLLSDPFVQNEGIALDDIHVYDHLGAIYAGASMASASSQTVGPGSEWVHFKSNNQLVASVLAGSQALGITNVQAYINGGAVRNANGQYYLDRNVTIKPQSLSLSDSVTLRLYFLDSEVESILTATNCVGCDAVTSAYRLGVSKYSDVNQSMEDGDIANNMNSTWSFIANATKVPYDQGYYAEFKVKDFSEFWLSKGLIGDSTPLPVRLVHFNAHKDAELPSVSLVWSTAEEQDFDHFEVELALGDRALKGGDFEMVGSVNSGGSPLGGNYKWDFAAQDLSETHYFRLKMVDRDGSFAYSGVRSVLFDGSNASWIYPNPVAERVRLKYEAAAGSDVVVRLMDQSGKVLKTDRWKAEGGKGTWDAPLDRSQYAAGLYLLELTNEGSRKVYKFVKK
ncbi:putative secreted protein (Por secretion system target) [Dyadobacter jejuensis]|uniref:Putative secreted protein (Por secretion system target) n=1 Tax=Dyadobacter jejuensis TaxID=1082580 RepID=A0A316ALQ8_9BACT|nr:S8 family serine peptidase [Dyadobacter jejuensis]PWJ57760.1 putative secreted protein (Por secretion system target) [Dyadobacter jejuensis]